MSERAIQNLEQYQGQLDEDGIFVAVSRQALNETLDYIDSLRKELEEVKFALQVEENDNEYNCAEKDKLKEENERLRALTEWQPIESAPRDRTFILITDLEFHPDYCYVASWVDSPANGVWKENSYGGCSHPKPTHWMPLPKAPQIEEK